MTSGLESVALIAGLACILLGEQAVLTWMAIATAILLAADMAYSETDVPPAIQAVWMLGQVLLLSALRASAELAGVGPICRGISAGTPAGQVDAPLGIVRHPDSAFDRLRAAVGDARAIPMHPVWTSFFSVLFVVALMIGMVWLTDCFDEPCRA